MKYFISLAVTFILFTSSLFCFAADHQVTGEEASLLLERIKQNQAEIKTITGSFTEERHISTMPMPLLFSGKVYAEPPGFLFLAYEEPIRHIMKVSGDTVLFYVEDAEAADVVNMKTAGESAPPNMFGWDPTNFKGEILETATGYTLYTPDIKAGGREIRIVLNKQTLMVQELIMQEPGGDVTKIVMDGLLVNAVIPAGILEYKLPAGVTLNVMGQ